jgi:biotin transport system permease protein
MIAGYCGQKGWLHRLPAGAKLACLGLGTLGLAAMQDWRALALCLVAVAGLALSLGRHGARRLLASRTLLPFLLLVGALQGWAKGWEAGAVTVLRLAAAVLLADLVTMTTTTAALTDALAPALAPLRHLGLEPRRLALAMALVLRFVPLLLTLWQARQEAWRARSHGRLPLRLVALLLADALRLADQVGLALEARASVRPPRP